MSFNDCDDDFGEVSYNDIHFLIINSDDARAIIDLIEKNKSIIKEVATEWQSDYNSYVVYDYEPFCTQGFSKRYKLKFSCKEYKEFVLYQLKKIRKELILLATCFSNEMEVKK